MRKIYLLTCLFVISISCQKEEIKLLQEQSNNQEKQLQQQIEFKDLPRSILQNFDERRSIKLKVSKNNVSFGAVRTDIPVIKQMGKGGVANYTFGLTRSSSQKSSSLYFDNFVVQELQSGKQMKYLIHYEPEENWYYNKNRDLANYSGRIKIYNIQAELLGNMDIVNGELLPVQQQKMNDELECMLDLDSIWCIGDVNGGDTYSCYYHYTMKCSGGSSGGGGSTFEDIPYESPSGGSWENDPTGGGSGSSGDPDDTAIDTTPILLDDEEAVEKFINQDVWNNQDPYDEWNKLTQCEKDFFSSNPAFLYIAKLNRKMAKEGARSYFPNCDQYKDVADAFRHSYFSALNTQSMGYYYAKKLGTAHECEDPAGADKNMDLNNNQWGYDFANSRSYFTQGQFYDVFINESTSINIIILENCD